MSTYEREAVELRLAQERTIAAERRATASELRAVEAEHRLRHARVGLQRIQTRVERVSEEMLTLLEGAGASEAEVTKATATRGRMLELIAEAVTLSEVCNRVPHPGVQGEKQWNARLTEELVRTIRRRTSAGEKHSTVAADLGVSRSNVSIIAKGKSWSHVQ